MIKASSSQPGYLEIAKYLVDNGVDVNIQNEDGETALMLASSHSNLSLVRYLVAKGANLEILNKVRKTVLLTVRMICTDLLDTLIDWTNSGDDSTTVY